MYNQMVKVTVDYHQSNTGLEGSSFLSEGTFVPALHTTNEDDGVLLFIMFDTFMPSGGMHTRSSNAKGLWFQLQCCIAFMCSFTPTTTRRSK